MEQIILIFHVLAAIAIIGLIMIQQGKGASMGASFGSGASQTVFGSAGGGNMLTKSTTILATLFFATSFGLAVVAKDKAASVGAIDMPAPAVVQSKIAELPEADMPEVDSDEIPQMAPVSVEDEMPSSPSEQ